MRFESIVPELLKPAYDVFGFSPAMRTGNEIFFSGQIGVNPDLSVPAELEVEVDQAFQYLGVILEACGGTFDDVIEITSYHVADNLMHDANVLKAVKARYMSEPHCAWTTVGVSALLIPGARVEIRARAILKG
jgi:enamine deaminase RidA (YjgF/YER057c/UK114 family)